VEADDGDVTKQLSEFFLSDGRSCEGQDGLYCVRFSPQTAFERDSEWGEEKNNRLREAWSACTYSTRLLSCPLSLDTSTAEMTKKAKFGLQQEGTFTSSTLTPTQANSVLQSLHRQSLSSTSLISLTSKRSSSSSSNRWRLRSSCS
jgi:hypothetical protein